MPNTWTDPYANVGASATPYKTQKASNASEQVLGLYQSNFGRSASSPEIDTWVQNAGGGSYLSPDQLSYVQQQFQKAPEYSQYTGQRPTIASGDYIPGVTLGQSLQSDPYFRGASASQGPAPLPGAEQPPTMGGGLVYNNAPAEQETSNAGMQDAVRQQIMGLLDPNRAMPSMQDPNIANAMSAYSAGKNKATARQVNQNAEAFGAAGLESSGARLGADRSAIESQGLNEATFGSNLILQQTEQEKARVMQALQLAMAQGDQDVSRRLQERLAQLNAAVQREGLAQTGRLGDADIALRNSGLKANTGLGLMGLMQNDRQFNDSLGWDISKYEAAMNNQALVNLLYGG